MHNKKTILDENATIYQRNAETKIKQSLKNMSGRDKLQYFKDYYLKTVLISIVILTVIIYLLNTLFFSNKDYIFTVVVTDGYQLSDYKSTQLELRKILGIKDEQQDVFLDAIYNPDKRLYDLLRDNSIDILVMNKEFYDKYSKVDVLADLSKIYTSSELSSIQSKLENNKVYEMGENDTLIDTGKKAPFGIKITEKSLFTGITPYTKDIYIGVPKGAKHPENAIKILNYLVK